MPLKSGDVAPDFTLPDLAGVPHTLSTLRGTGPSISVNDACLGLGKFTVVLVGLRPNISIASFFEGRAKFVDSGSAALRVQIAFLVTLTITPSGAPNWNRPS